MGSEMCIRDSFYTFGNYQNADRQTYSRIFTDAIRNEAQLFVPSIFLSEFSNTYIRSEYKRYLYNNHFRPNNFPFKTGYKATDDYKTTVQDVKNIILNQILAVCKKLDDPFTSLDISSMFDNEDTFDFNDRYYSLLAKHYDLKIVTNDADFSSISGISIITRNNALLNTTH